MAGKCGDCSLCCTVMGIHDLVPPKPMGVKCSNCFKMRLGSGPATYGCGIYETRPESCSTYECVWLASQHTPHVEPMPREMRPDKIHALINPTATDDCLIVEMDPRFPMAWKYGPLADWIKAMLRQAQYLIDGGKTPIKVIISTGAERMLVVGYQPNRKFLVRKMVQIEGEDGLREDGGLNYTYDRDLEPETV